jgi:hypothetical protein
MMPVGPPQSNPAECPDPDGKKQKWLIKGINRPV